MIDLLRSVGEALYGERWQAPLAEALAINPRTVQRWAVGDGAPNPGHWREMVALVETRIACLQAVVGPLRAATDRREARPTRRTMSAR
jgi:hypothetical protein